MSAKQGIDFIRAKQGATDASLDQNYHADQMQKVFDDLNARARPEQTGQNIFEQEILLVSGNTLDSVVGANIDTYVKAKTNVNLAYPNVIYDTNQFTIESGIIQLNKINVARSFEFSVGGTITSNSQDNAALVGIRLMSTSGPLTGAAKIYPAGVTSGVATVKFGFTTVGFATIPAGESIWLELSKNFIGTLVVDNMLIACRPLW